MRFIEVEKNKGSATLWVGKRRVIQVGKPSPTATIPPFTLMLAHKGGRHVLLKEAETRWQKARLACGVVLYDRRVGSLLVQWRGWAA